MDDPTAAIDQPEALLAVLTEARTLGFLGPGDVEPHVAHALVFVTATTAAIPHRALDLGSGGGLPGLVLALWPAWSTTEWVLVDAGERRCAFLTEAVEQLGLAGRVTVRRGRAEELGRAPELREQLDLVTARSFASAAITAECAAPFLALGGELIVSEPPEAVLAERWPLAQLSQLGLGPARLVREAAGGVAVLTKVAACPDRYPRRVGIPNKRPLY